VRDPIKRACCLFLLGTLPWVLLSCAAPRQKAALLSVPVPAPAADIAPPSAREIASAERNVRAHKNDVKALAALADIYLRAGKQPEAALQLRRIVRGHPGNIEAHRRLASLYHDAGYLDREYESLGAIVARAPDDWQSTLRMAEIALDAGWTDIAEPLLARSLPIAPNEPRIYLGMASLNFLRHQWPEMERNARHGLFCAPDNAASCVVLSEALRLQGHLPDAEKAMRAAIARTTDRPGLTRQYARLAHLLLDPNWHPMRAPEAEQAARTALQSTEADLEARYWLARAQELQGRIPEAEKNYAEAAREDLQFESLPFFLGRIYQRSTDPAQRTEGERLLAVYRVELENSKHYERANELVRERPGDSAVHRTLARWYLKMGRAPSAILELRRVLQMNGRDTEARNLLRQTLRSQGRISEAKQL
jgi:predicted Zn-dependent protease